MWAPQVIWDENYTWPDGQRGGYFVYYSLLNSKEDQYDRIFYSYADPSFTRLTKPRLLFDWGYATIDADIVWVEADKKWHMMIKKEGGQRGHLHHEVGEPHGNVARTGRKRLRGLRGEQKVRGRIGLPHRRRGGLARGLRGYSSRPIRYRICKADEYLSNFHSPEDIKGVADPQHGSFLPLTKKEYRRLEKHWKQEL